MFWLLHSSQTLSVFLLFLLNESLGELGPGAHQGQDMSHGSKNAYKGTSQTLVLPTENQLCQ